MSSVKSTKCVRKLERPRPLRLNSDSDGSSTASTVGPANGAHTDSPEPCAFAEEEEVVRELEVLHTSVNNGNFDATISAQIAAVCTLLMAKGAAIDSSNKELLDRYFVTLRNAARDERLDACSRLRLLQVIEQRSMHWEYNRNAHDFYQRMIQQFEEEAEVGAADGFVSSGNSSANNSPPRTSHGKAQQQQQQLNVHSLSTMPSSPPFPPQPTDVPKSLGMSGNKPAGIPGRSLPRDATAMRNVDSGRVAPGARDHRPVQTRGHPSGEEAALRAQDLVGRSASTAQQRGDGAAAGHRLSQETNQGPSLVQRGGMGDASMAGGFTETVSVDGETLRITGGNPALVRLCKVVLDKYFAGEMVFSDEVAAELPAQQENKYAAKAASSSIIRGSTGGQSLAARGPSDPQSRGHWTGTPSGGDGGTVSSRDGQGAPQNKTVATVQSAERASLFQNAAPQAAAEASGTGDGPEPGRQVTRRESCPAFSARPSRPAQVQSSVSLDASDPPATAPRARTRSYSRDFLLQCSQSDLSLQPPPDFPPLDAEVENLMVKEDRRHSTAPRQEGNLP